jgi:nitrite reductase/ring-hydroxylating ferredoxin subunit
MVPPPSPDRFATEPATWYLLCASRQLKRAPLSRAMLGRRLVGYRTTGGQPIILDAQCPHLGADLGRGRIIGDRLQCPFHGWEYGPDGRCRHIPCQDEIPAFARLRSYPVVERHGFVFFFNGSEPLFPLPFFLDEEPDQFVAGRPFSFVVNCPWYMMASNGFDLEHFQVVHDRKMIDEPWVDSPAPFARRMNYRARITGRSIYDRLIRRFLGSEVQVTITSWAGPFIVVTSRFQRACSYLIICGQPLPEDATLVETIVFARGMSGPLRPLVQPLGLWLRRLFTQGFLANDTARLVGVRYSPHSLVQGDAEMAAFFDWLVQLPQARTALPCSGSRQTSAGVGCLNSGEFSYETNGVPGCNL